jgi:hypothetical protein
MKTAPVRVKVRTHQLLKRMADHAGRPVADVLEDAVERYRRGQLFDAADAAYRRAASKQDPDAALWETALADGLIED